MNPTRLAIRRPVSMAMLVTVLVLAGIIFFQQLPVQELPNTSFPFVTVSISYPGASPEQMETLVTLPVENAVSGISGITQVNGNSSSGNSRVSMQFAAGTDVNAAANDVSQVVNRIQRSLPSGIQTPSINKANPNASPIMSLALYGASPVDLYNAGNNVLLPALQEVPGVAAVSLQGGLVPQVNVTVKSDALSAYGVSLNQINTAINGQNVNLPGGTTTSDGLVRSVTTNGYFQNVNDIRNLVVVNRPGSTPLTLGQLADVQLGYAPVNQQTQFDGQPAVALQVSAQSGANIVQVDDAVKRKLAQVTRTLPPGTKTAIVNDSTVYTHESIQAVEDDLVLAVILPAIVLLLFLHRFRNTIIVVLAIPTSLISTFAVMYFLGFSLDLISLLALSLITGILVDDSVVVLENINRHLSMGKSPVRAAIDGRLEIGLAAVAITLTDVVVYAPISFTQGLVGQIFREFGLTIVTATLFSLFVSFTVAPLLASRWLREPLDEEHLESIRGGGLWNRFTGAWERNYGHLRDAYGRLIGTALRVRPLVILIGVAALALSIGYVSTGVLGTEFAPQEDNSQFGVNVNFPTGTPLDRTTSVVFAIDKQIRAMPGVKQTYATAGARGGFFGGGGTNSGSINVDLVPVGQRPSIDKYLAQVRALGRAYPDATIGTNVESGLGFGGGGGNRAASIQLYGPDINVLNEIAAEIATAVKPLPGVAEVNNQAAQTVPELSVQLNSAAMAEYGVTASQIGSTVATLIGGSQVGNLSPNGSTLLTPIVVSLPNGSTMTPAQIENLPLATSSGTTIRLGQVAHVVPTTEPSQLSDQNRQLTVSVSATADGTVPLGQMTQEIQRAVNALNLPAGYSFTFGGAAQQQAQVFAPLEGAFALSILLIYMLTSALYESLLYPLAVILSLPLAIVGAFTALVLTGNTLNLYSFMGLIMLVGLVAKNAILLVDYTNTLRSRGMERNAALKEAGRTRLRPILMTTSTMVFAMLPLAVKIGAGSEERSPMATVLVGGLLTSTLLTLVFVPVLYTYLDGFGSFLERHGASIRKGDEIELSDRAGLLESEPALDGTGGVGVPAPEGVATPGA